MSLPKKRSRNIVVGGVAYRWCVSKFKKLGAWRASDAGEVDEEWQSKAACFGLGDVADVQFTIMVERQQNGSSRIHCAFSGLMVEGFLGRQQLAEVKPRLVRKIIERALASGWDPAGSGEFSLALLEGEDETPDVLSAPAAKVVGVIYQAPSTSC